MRPFVPFPTVVGKLIGDNRCRVLCPFCGEIHGHGCEDWQTKAPGWRTPDCSSERLLRRVTDYYVVITKEQLDAAEAYNSEVLEERVKYYNEYPGVYG